MSPVFTNEHDLPDYLQQWLMNDEYDHVEGVVSATGLNSSVRATILKERHMDDLEIDITDMIARVYGTALHASFENIIMPRIKQEQRVVCVMPNGQKVSGKYDMLKTITSSRSRIIDIKSTGVYNYIYQYHIEEWKLQLSTYKYILEHDGWTIIDGTWLERKAITVDRTAEICLVFTDWKREEALRNDKYPNIRVASMDVKLFGEDFIEGYITDKLDELVKARELPDDALPFCTDEELWRGKDKYAVMKHGNKKASKQFDTTEEAEQYIEGRPEKEQSKYRIDKRPGLVKHCPFCDARSVCNQYPQLLAEGLIKEFEEE